MSQPKNKLRPKSTPKALSTPLKKLPSKKARQSAKKDAAISIDVRTGRKDYNSIIELAKRKLHNASTSKMPSDIKPMLATLVDEAFNDEDWQFELKLDGYRSLAYVKNGKAEIRSRNNNSFNKKFEPIYDALLQWNINAVVDGEIVVLNEEGVPDFNGIQQWNRKKQGQLVYYIFDLLWLDGLDLMQEPLHIRQEILKQIIPENSALRFSDHIDAIGKDFFEIARQNNLEGIIAKKKDAPYIPDSRSKTWLKIKAEQRHEAIICGYTKKRDTDRLFSSLLLGVYEKGKLKYIGQAGTGYSASLQQELVKKMKPHVTQTCPFEDEPSLTEPTVWLKPFLVCEVKYTELTNEGVMRHASFQGLREDKAAFELNDEKEQDADEVIAEVKEEELQNQSTSLISKSEAEKIVTVDGHNLKFTNLKKIFWPKEKITKGDLLNYYGAIADYMMPYMKDRPQSLNRFPNGIEGKNFYHKNMGGKVDSWLKTFQRFSDSSGEPKDFLICTNTASLLYMANLGCIEMNPWHSRVQSPLFPDWCVIDLDPGAISFEKVIETAQVVKQVLDTLQVPSYPKTSGSTGIHIYIPLGAKYNYEQSKQLAELVVNLVHEELPAFTSLIRNPQKRKDKIYLDYLQNRPIQTICAPYSVRPKPGATVSAPLHWSEVKKGLKISAFTIKNIFERVKTEGDLFEGVLGKGIDLNKTLKGLANLI
ncbi:MAG: DNA ligase D [Flavisolibacter sp.]|jgi:bifunctional non-homologous end joining protein LigD